MNYVAWPSSLNNHVNIYARIEAALFCNSSLLLQLLCDPSSCFLLHSVSEGSRSITEEQASNRVAGVGGREGRIRHEKIVIVIGQWKKRKFNI